MFGIVVGFRDALPKYIGSWRLRWRTRLVVSGGPFRRPERIKDAKGQARVETSWDLGRVSTNFPRHSLFWILCILARLKLTTMLMLPPSPGLRRCEGLQCLDWQDGVSDAVAEETGTPAEDAPKAAGGF